MHAYQMPALVAERVERRMGKPLANAAITGGRAALVVIDMQNYFCAQGFPAEVPLTREIVPNINRVASAMRGADGKVVWLQTTVAGASQHWANYQQQMLSPQRQQERLVHLDEGSEGFQLFPSLEVLPGDLHVKKIMYSAFVQGSSDIGALLKGHKVDTLLVAGTLTNVCCESSAQDAMMLGYSVIMLSDGNATLTDEEHAAALNTFAMYFGDVMTSDEVIGRLTTTWQSKHPDRDILQFAT